MTKCRIRRGWDGAGTIGKVLGENVYVNSQFWTPVLWDDEEDPNWFTTARLEFFEEGKKEKRICLKCGKELIECPYCNNMICPNECDWCAARRRRKLLEERTK